MVGMAVSVACKKLSHKAEKVGQLHGASQRQQLGKVVVEQKELCQPPCLVTLGTSSVTQDDSFLEVKQLNGHSFMVLHELGKLQLKGVFIEGVGDMVEGAQAMPRMPL